MNLDDILEMTTARTPGAFDRARTRRAGRRLLHEHARTASAGRSAVGDHDLEEAVGDVDEAERIIRTAQLAGAGTFAWYADTGRITWSDLMARMFGHQPGPGTPLLSLELIAAGVHPDDRERVERAVERAWSRTQPAEFDFRLCRPDRTMRHVRCLVEVLTDGGRRRGIVATAVDVTEEELERQERERRRRRRMVGIAEPIRIDAATGLLNRATLIDEIDIRAQSGGGAVLVVGVDPASGSAQAAEADRGPAPRTVGAVLERLAGRAEICGVVGPGEYGILLPAESLGEAAATARRIVSGLRDQLAVDAGGRWRLAAWGGVVGFTERHRARGRDLVRDAEAALRQSHREGACLTVRPEPGDRRSVDDAQRGEVRRAIAADRLRLHAQPLLDLTLNEITRHEILLRVLDDRGRPCSPEALLEIAENVDEVAEVDRWVIDRALAMIGQGPRTSHFQINLSSRSISKPGLLHYVEDAIARHAIDPGLLTFEITESAAIDNLTAARRFADRLTAQGCGLALDDFGVGNSSLLLLKTLPVDLVKIDGAFVEGLRRNEFDQVVVRSVARLCADLGVRTAAEYATDGETIDILRDAGIGFAQGYAIGRPEPIGAAHPATATPDAPGGASEDPRRHRATG